MHNSPEKNLRFAIQFAQTNLRYLLGEKQTGKVKKLIARNRHAIRQSLKKLVKIPHPYWPDHSCLGTRLA
jgi:hypothetical protein